MSDNPFSPDYVAPEPEPMPRYWVTTQDRNEYHDLVPDPAFFGNYTHVVVMDRETGEAVAAYDIGERFDDRDAAWAAARAEAERLEGAR